MGLSLSAGCVKKRHGYSSESKVLRHLRKQWLDLTDYGSTAACLVGSPF